jgi:cytidine deaminase
MNFDFLISSANDEIQKRYAGGAAPNMGDTICLICSENGTVYKGYNSLSPTGDNIHAEVAAVNSLRADGQTMIRGITVYDSFKRVPIIPCTGCLNMLLSIDYRNINTVIVTPTGNIPITNFLGNNGGMNSGNMNSGNMMNQGVPQSGYMNPNMSGNMSQNMNMNPNMSQNMNAYMNPNMSQNMSGYMNPNAYGGNSVYRGQSVHVNSVNGSMYMNSVTQSLGRKAYTAGGGQKSSALKNKLNDLLNDDDDDED